MAMRRILGIYLWSAGAVLAQSEQYDFQPQPGARFALTVEKTGLWSGRKHVFEFQRYGAMLRFDRADPARSVVELTIEAGSAVCNDTWLSEKDRRKVLEFMFRDMLDVTRHPRITFKSTGVVSTGDKMFDVSGTLTIRGVERPAQVSVTIVESGGALTAVTGRATVRLTDYGLKPPKAALGAIGTKNEMSVDFRLELLTTSSAHAGALTGNEYPAFIRK
jgi:polyisoprenoid-binding protein YceI